jgi:hypothetical protein
MSFNRLSYDTCSYKETLGQNVSQLSYVLDPIKYEHCSKCRHDLGLVGGTAVSHVTGNLVDLENNLLGIDRPGTKCPEYKWLPPAPDAGGVQGKEYIKPVAHPFVGTALVHLPECQMIDYAHVPAPPPVRLSQCGAPRG